MRAPEGQSTRPTSDRVREALFGILGARVVDANFLDLCAGSGAVGLEAYSRGAGEVVFVEQSRRALAVLENNVETLSAAGSTRIIAKDATSALRALAAKSLRFDIVFVDPPYDSGLSGRLLRSLSDLGVVSPGTIVVVEHRLQDPHPDEVGALRRYQHRRYGETALSFYSDE